MQKNNWRIIFLLLALCYTQSAFATPTTPTSDFIGNGDGTVTHKKTGLIWQRCAVGQTWSGGGCTGTAITFTSYDAKTLTSNFASKSDWRLPNIVELQTIVERENSNPAINTTIFPDAPTNYFWSSSLSAEDSRYVWYVYFNSGEIALTRDYGSFAVRLVRGGQSLGIDSFTPNRDFIDNKDGTVTHKRTGLMWQRCSIGQTWINLTCSGKASIYSYEQALALTSSFASYNDWRVPNANELASIVEYNSYYPAINTTQFPNPSSNHDNTFWSSSPDVDNTDYAWDVDFDSGYVARYYRNSSVNYGIHISSLAVRLVRGTWSAPAPSNLDLTQANCRYVAPIYSQTWQRMKIKKAPTCAAVLRYHTWLNFIYPQNQIVSSYYDNRLANIDTSNQLLTAYLKHIDDGIAVIDTLLDPDLRRVLTPSKYKLSTQIMKSKGIVQSLKDGQTIFERRGTLGRVLDKTFKDKIVAESGSNTLCKLFFEGAVRQSCSTEVSKIVGCTEHLVGEGWKGVSGCVLGGITTTVGLMNNALDIFEVISIRKYNTGYILMTDYLHGYFEKGTMVLPSDAALEQAIQTLAANMSFSSGDYDMVFVKNGILDSINRTAVTANHNVLLVNQLKAILK